MMSRKWKALLVVLALIGLVVAAFPSGALFTVQLAWWLVAHRSEPPRLLRAYIVGDEWFDRRETPRKLSTFFETLFPPGTSAAVMVRMLRNQGFDFAKHPNLPCYSEGQRAPIGVLQYPCFDPTKRLEYGWNVSIVCGVHIIVDWSTDDRGAITKINANSYGACL